MRHFTCACGARLFFGNDQCLSCHRAIGFDPIAVRLTALEPSTDGDAPVWEDLSSKRLVRRCSNWSLSGCPWLVPAQVERQLCRACLLNRVIPPVEDPTANALWRRVEAAKRRWVYGLLTLGLPLRSRIEDPKRGLALDVKAPLDGKPVVTGHAEGVVTLSLDEADPVVREETKQQFRERYRTLLGHLRHESGHYYWMLLIEGTPFLEKCRAVFGDERDDYQAALKRHYERPADQGWSSQFVSAYASAHPWEDWAETWAHYLHLIDTFETALYFRMLPRDDDPRADFSAQLEAWSELAIGMNALNRSLGLPDPYPFVMNETIRRKLAFVDEVVTKTATEADRPTEAPTTDR